jgi:hypothetical protein
MADGSPKCFTGKVSGSALRKAVKKLIDGDVSQLNSVRSAGQAELEESCGHLQYELKREAVADVLRKYASGEILSGDAQLWASFVRRGYLGQGKGPLRPLEIHYDIAHEDQIAEAISRLDELGDAVDGTLDSEEALQLISALFTHPSNLQDVLQYMREHAPVDVLDTIVQLEADEWRATKAWGGTSEPFGNLTISFTREQDELTVIRDRGQWCLEFMMVGWTSKFDLGIVLDAMNNRETWDDSIRNPYELKQLPEGVAWVKQVPEVLAWLGSVADGESRLNNARGKRWLYLYPGWDPPSSEDPPVG